MICLLHFLVWKRSAMCLWSHSQVQRTIPVSVWTSQAKPEKCTRRGNFIPCILFCFLLRSTVSLHSFNWNSVLARTGGSFTCPEVTPWEQGGSLCAHSSQQLEACSSFEVHLCRFIKVGCSSWIDPAGGIYCVRYFHLSDCFCLVEDGN